MSGRESAETLLEAVTELARLAGETALAHFRDSLMVELKGDGSPVTDADRSAERAARDWISRRFPDDGILGEEYGTERPEELPEGAEPALYVRDGDYGLPIIISDGRCPDLPLDLHPECTAVGGKYHGDARVGTGREGDGVHAEAAAVVTSEHMSYGLAILEEDMNLTVQCVGQPVLEQMRVGADGQAEHDQPREQQGEGDPEVLQVV